MDARGCTSTFDLLVAHERGDLPEVVGDNKESDEDLGGGDAADAATAGGFDVCVA
ncbi:hypothetical protein IFU08_14590 [Microbacterium sp. CFBP 8790]|uniref:hypothetical protein n=1 Tax=Microbacterium sp. CFBP 8790 TaxID=2775271 RepID=UPI00177E27DF|nr:hypothetical protein [Microbacterium sp. CFBP 8790]MBD8207881.1 hypothetical protein [Microbacterium sp. CFBP 8801]MBD8510783.1 hypothetical protein [Microbacterium sp. CFBP 8790]